MKNTISLGTYGGIPLKLHWTFSLLVVYLVATVLGQGTSLEEGLWFGAYVVALFGCVVLHEYGHAFAAKKMGVKTEDIVLSPIGGVARLKSIPEQPKQELIIALAGPAVNVVIAILLGIFLVATIDLSTFDPNLDLMAIQGLQQFLVYLFAINVILVVFNMIPAFPMDGGRVLRSLLAMKLDRVKATSIASNIGRVLAIAFIAFGLYNQSYVIALIGGFIFLTATAENRVTRLNSRLSKVSLTDIMKTQFTRLHIGDAMSIPIDLYQRDVETSFLVFDSLGYISGSLPDLFIKNAIQDNLEEEKVGNYMSRKIAQIDVSTPIQSLIDLMNKEGLGIVGVVDNEELVGVVDRRAVSRILMD